jgi:hypothetical protein
MKKVGERTSLGEIRSLARSHGRSAINTLKSIMNDKTAPAMSRVTAAKLLLDRGFGKPNETHHIDVDGETSLLKVVNEIVHVYETREQIEFNDQTPLLEINPRKNGGNTH